MGTEIGRLNFEFKQSSEELKAAILACRGIRETLLTSLRGSGTEVWSTSHWYVNREYGHDGISGNNSFIFPPQEVIQVEKPHIGYADSESELTGGHITAAFDPSKVEGHIEIVYEDDSTGNNVDFIIYDLKEGGSVIPRVAQEAIEDVLSKAA